MQIKIVTQSPELLEALIKDNAPGSIVAIGDDIKLKYENILSLRGFSVEPYTAQMVTFVLEHCDVVATSILATWLYDKLKGRKAELHIGKNDDVMISPEAICKALKEKEK